jgi:hypothetical protein
VPAGAPANRKPAPARRGAAKVPGAICRYFSDLARPNDSTDRGGRRGIALALLASITAVIGILGSAEAGVPPRPPVNQIIHTKCKIVPIPAAIPHQAGDMVDRRILPDLTYIAEHFPIYVSDGYSGPLPNGKWVGCHNCHVANSDHKNGLAVDLVPVKYDPRCDKNWRAITRLAAWAEPRQNHPNPPFRWVGYNGDYNHGCGNHLHLSWNHAEAKPHTLARWVQVFKVKGGAPADPPGGGGVTPGGPGAPVHGGIGGGD